jgi:hypothetical protein
MATKLEHQATAQSTRRVNWIQAMEATASQSLIKVTIRQVGGEN